MNVVAGHILEWFLIEEARYLLFYVGKVYYDIWTYGQENL